jgi:signal transduction histidine kinase
MSLDKKFFQKLYFKSYFFYILIIFTLVFSVVRFFLFQNELKQARNIFIEEQNIKTIKVQNSIDEKFTVTYETLRTISFLPEVRKITNEGQKLSPDTESAIQQMYNNIYDNIHLSEIYIIPKDFDHDKKSQFTGKAQEPISVFDEFITDSKSDKLKSDYKKKIEEVEDFEYRVHKKQLKYLSLHFPTNSKITRLNIPLLTSSELITCDNSDLTYKNFLDHDDTPRMGIVFTVPKYDISGKLNGAISAVIRTNILKSYLPAGNYGLINMKNKNQIIQEPTTDWLNSVNFFKEGQTNPNLIYSKTLPIKSLDQYPWSLWVAIPDSEFINSINYKNAYRHFYIEIIWSLLIIISIYLLQVKVLNNSEEVEIRNIKLDEQKIKLEKDNLLLQVLSHDVANTLSVIQSGISILDKYDDIPSNPIIEEKKRNIKQKITIASKAAIGVLNHVKELKAIEKGKIEMSLRATSIEEIFEIALVIFENSLTNKNIKLTLVNKNSNSHFLCHPTSFSNSVFNNLISNAIKFSPNNSEIIIRTESLGENFKISIKDSGIGIPKDLALKLFNNNTPISRLGTKGEQGTGFGLTLAKSYVEYYGGTLSFTSEVIGEPGTTFEIILKAC